MFELVEIEDVVRIPPVLFNLPLREAAKESLIKDYEGIVDPEVGKIICVVDVISVGVGKLIPGDGASYHPVRFTVLSFKPRINEIVEGSVVEIVDFGVFVRVGPLDGLCHISQIADDFFSYDGKKGQIIGKNSGKILMPGDSIRAKVIAVSLSKTGQTGKFALSMRNPFLGKIDWIKKEIDRIHKEEEKKAKK
ncbi:MAG: DNA-directed RNA polymerase [Candidatus Asgardarchaeia archaeon]